MQSSQTSVVRGREGGRGRGDLEVSLEPVLCWVDLLPKERLLCIQHLCQQLNQARWGRGEQQKIMVMACS